MDISSVQFSCSVGHDWATELNWTELMAVTYQLNHNSGCCECFEGEQEDQGDWLGTGASRNW